MDKTSGVGRWGEEGSPNRTHTCKLLLDQPQGSLRPTTFLWYQSLYYNDNKVALTSGSLGVKERVGRDWMPLVCEARMTSVLV